MQLVACISLNFLENSLSKFLFLSFFRLPCKFGFLAFWIWNFAIYETSYAALGSRHCSLTSEWFCCLPAFVQPGFGYQQQLVPGMRPGGAPMANFFVPMVQQGQQGQRPGGRRAGAGPVQQNQQPVPPMQQQMLPRGGRMYRYPPGRNMPDMPMPGVPGGMLSMPYDMGGMPLRDAAIPQPIPISALASALANATPEQQRTMLGESLYPLVDQLEHEMAAKVTGMLLEMDQTEVLHLLESPDALKAKVAEAMEVLRNVQQQASSPTDQLASLSLGDNLVP
ncbi:polyadenylate-binding protein 8-like [Macadamia integrifolia]|uniref:polyadenylate-binding protein 8-like n=1 Tax=Macadamia integrifolia TaxID=60698 RepID=UPI001C4F943B|nr:polyadenylate-binding protein 8-like [Macadamia integrifolia]